jgi:EmrB/QacA subfamily drug resistance transporter
MTQMIGRVLYCYDANDPYHSAEQERQRTTMTSTETPAGRSAGALFLLSAAGLLAGLDFMIMNVALPAIQDDLGFSPADLQWVISAYALAFGGFLLLGGRLADITGARRMFMTGFALFGTASLFGGLISNGFVLILARAGQGLGAALLVPAALALIAVLYAGGAERNRAMGFFAAMQAAGSTLGLVAGGLLVDGPGWRWVMLVNVPLGGTALALAPRLLPGNRSSGRGARFDVGGAALVTGSLVALLYGLVTANDHGWASLHTIALVGAGIIGLAGFAALERRIDQPLIPWTFLTRVELAISNLAAFFLTASAWSLFFILTLHMQHVLGWSALETGLAYLPMGVTIFLVARFASPALIARVGARATLGLALALNAGALLWLATQMLTGGDYLRNLVAPMVVLAVANGLGNATAIVAALEGARPNEQGLASGMVSAALQIGGAFGVAVLVAVATSVTGSSQGLAALNDGYRAAIMAAAGLSALGAILAGGLAIATDGRQDREPVRPAEAEAS